MIKAALMSRNKNTEQAAPSSLSLKQYNCIHIRAIYDQVIDLYKIRADADAKRKDQNAISRICSVLFSCARTTDFKASERLAKEAISKIINEDWAYMVFNGKDASLGKIMGSSMFENGRECMQVSQLWVVVNFFFNKGVVLEPEVFLRDVLTSLYDSSEVLYNRFLSKEPLTLADITLIDKESLFKDYVLFNLSALIPNSEELYYTVFNSHAGEKPHLIEEVIQLNVKAVEAHKQIKNARKNDQKAHYMKWLFKDLGELGAFAGLFVLEQASNKLAGLVPFVGNQIESLLMDPANAFLLRLTKNYFEGKKPKDIVDLQIKLGKVFEGKSTDMNKGEGKAYDLVQDHLKCPACKNHFFDMMTYKTSQLKPKKLKI